MTVGEYLTQAVDTLKGAGITTARLDCLILLEDALGHNRANIIAHPEHVLSTAQQTLLNTYVVQRKQHLPLAYIRGKAAFFGRTFTVNEHVLVPRPESESLITLLLRIDFSNPPTITDVGTGSGCLGITAGLALPGSKIYVCDIDQPALDVAVKNAESHNLIIHAVHSDLLKACRHDTDIIIANLPYVPNDYKINTAATFEPSIALFSGKDGLDHYRTLWQQIATLRKKPAHVITEAFPEQHAGLRQLAQEAGYTQHESEGFAQHFALIA
jgi:release factor glutamine methyltransferase